MFQSARLKLTLFYFVIILAFSLALTISVRYLAGREYDYSNDVQRGAVRRLFRQFLDTEGHPAPGTFMTLQDDQASRWRERVNQELAIIDLAALVIGGIFSYWFAGRTLKPIEEAHEAQARFTADASHELRTPLTNMKLENEVFMRQKHFTCDDARDLIKSNLEEVGRLEALSSNLLDLTRFGQNALTLTPNEIEKIVERSMQQARKAAKAKQITLKKELKSGKVLGEQDSLVQLLGILLDNAIKYGPKGSEVIIRGQAHGDQYVLKVIDQGPGIDEDDLPYIFDRLYRADKARSSKVNGYGLGLALARQIAEANRATITASNSSGTGADFKIELNRAK